MATPSLDFSRAARPKVARGDSACFARVPLQLAGDNRNTRAGEGDPDGGPDRASDGSPDGDPDDGSEE